MSDVLVNRLPVSLAVPGAGEDLPTDITGEDLTFSHPGQLTTITREKLESYASS